MCIYCFIVSLRSALYFGDCSIDNFCLHCTVSFVLFVCYVFVLTSFMSDCCTTEFVDLRNFMYVHMEKSKYIHYVFSGQVSREIPLGRPGHRFDYCDTGRKQHGTDSCVSGNQIAGSIEKQGIS